MNYSFARKLVNIKKSIGQSKALRCVEKSVFNRSLWKFSYSSVARGFLIGMFWMMIPMPFQMLPAVIMCAYLRANIPVAIVCVWISNPLTWLPIYFANFILGSFLLDMNINVVNWQEYARYMIDNITIFWKPLYLGSIVGGLILGLVCFTLVYIVKWIRKGKS